MSDEKTPVSDGSDEGAVDSGPRTAHTLRAGAWYASRSLLAFSAVAVALLAAVYQVAQPRIEAAEAAQQLRVLQQILPADSFDNALLDDTIEVELPLTLSRPGADTVWRARRGGRPVAVILPVTTRDGYSGDIDLLVGIHRDGRVAAVRVVAHRETPGLGDAIEIARSTWIEQFNGRALGDPPDTQWRVRKDGGAFDQLTGATITPRAVVAAVREALAYHAQAHERLYTAIDTPGGGA